MLNLNKQFEYKFRVTYINGDYVDIYHYSDKQYADEAMAELYENADNKAYVTKLKPLRPMCINMYQVRSIEYLFDKQK